MEVNAHVHTAGMQIHMQAESTKQICAGEMHIGLQVMQPLQLFHLNENRNGSTLSVKFYSITTRENLFIYSKGFIGMDRQTEREREREREYNRHFTGMWMSLKIKIKECVNCLNKQSDKKCGKVLIRTSLYHVIIWGCGEWERKSLVS
jgi:hypothetical protein